MSTVSVDLSDSLHAAAGELAREAGVTVSQLLASALAEKVSAVSGSGWYEARAAKGDRVLFEAALAKVADVQPDERDRIPSR